MPKTLLALFALLLALPALAARDEATDEQLRESAYKQLLEAMRLPSTTKRIILDGHHEGSENRRGGPCKVEFQIGRNYVDISPQLLVSGSDLFHGLDERRMSVGRSWGGTVELATSYVAKGSKECNIFCTGTNVTTSVKEQLAIQLDANNQPVSYTHYRYERSREMSWLGKVPLGVPSWERRSEAVKCTGLRMLTQ